MSVPEPSADELARLFDTVVGAVTLRVSDLARQGDFYAGAIGLEVRAGGAHIVELVNANGQILLRLDDEHAAGSAPLIEPHTGLFHTAFRYPDRGSLAAAVKRTAELAPQYQGASDHGVSEAVYFADPEGNGIELYCDRPFEQWPVAEAGRVAMFTHPLDLPALVEASTPEDGPARCDVGHIHLMTADVEATNSFWRDVVGLNERQRFGPQATFLADGLYHHHLGANTWQSAGASPAPADCPGLEGFELSLRSPAQVEAAAERLAAAGHGPERGDGRVTFRDPDSNRVTLSSR